MKKTMLWAVLLTALLACKGNSTPDNSGEDGPAPDSVTTDVKDDATARLGDHEPTVALPTIVGMGPIDPLYEDNQVLAVAHLGLFSSVNALKASACHRFLESCYPELADIDKIEVDTGKGDLWLLRPRENGGSLAVNKITYHDDGSGNYDVEEVLYRTEDCRPILVRAKIDEYPYALQVNLVAENGQSVQWVPEFDWETRHLKESAGVVDITALPIENSIIMGAYYTAHIGDKSVQLRVLADHRLYIDEFLCTYQCGFTSDGRWGFYFYGGGDIEGFAKPFGHSEHGFDFELTPFSGYDFGIGLGNTAVFETPVKND